MCKTPNGESATCVTIYKCQVFMDAFKRHNPHVDFMRRSTCGFGSDKNPIVCCGSVATYQEITTSRSVVTQSGLSTEKSTAATGNKGSK